MNTPLERSFARIGARVKVRPLVRAWRETTSERFVALNVLRDREGEYFDVQLDCAIGGDVLVLDVQPMDRHLVLMARRVEHDKAAKHKFLCGHDERNWFVAAVPETAAVSTVRQAMQALKPSEVRWAEANAGLSEKWARRRRNKARVRQGEWFFVPAPWFDAKGKSILRNEPLSRGNGSKAHLMEECVREGGETVFVCSRHPAGVDTATYSRLIAQNPNARTWGWRVMRRNAEVYVRGTVRHRDHKTVKFAVWHRVFMNTENQAEAMRHVVFLD